MDSTRETVSLPVFPIGELSIYQSQWRIVARVTYKSPLRTFDKGANTGKVFHVTLLDIHGGEIRASFFNDAVDLHFDKLQEGVCYSFSRGTIKTSNRQFNQIDHRYELVFDRKADITWVADDATIKMVKLVIVELRSVQSRELPCNVDLCGIVTSAGQHQSVKARDGRDLDRREITIADDTATTLQVTLWGEKAKHESTIFEGNPVVGFKGVVVKEWNGGRSGSLSEGGSLIFKPTFPEAQKCQQWWSQGGSTQTLTALSQTGGGANGARSLNASPSTLADLRRAAEGLADQPAYYNIICRLAFVQTQKMGEPQRLYYFACQEPRESNGFPCNRRVDSSGYCSGCNRVGKVAPRLNIRCRFVDSLDSVWVTTFHEGAQRVLGMTGEEIQALENENGGGEALEAAISTKYFGQPVQVTVRAKLDYYNGEARPSITCIDAKPVTRGEHGRFMLKEISDMLSIGGFQ